MSMSEHQPMSRTQAIVLFATLAIVLIGAVVISIMVRDVNTKVAEAEEAARPADLHIVKLTTPTCKNCFDVGQAIAALKSQPVNITGEDEVFATSDEGKAFIQQYSITKIPTLLAHGELASDKVKSFLSANGEVMNDTFVLRNIPPVYIDPATGKEHGGVTLVSLVDVSCKDCYDVANHKNILEGGFGMALVKEETVALSSAEGQRLRMKYKITSVPTILLSPDASAYAQLQQVWPNVGTIEKDGWYVFRTMEAMGGVVYKDLAKGKIIRPEPKK